MKRVKKWVVGMLTMILVLVGMPLHETEVKAAAQSGDYEYKVNEEGNSVAIIAYKGSGGAVVIPTEIEGKKVICIGERAFWGCGSLTSVMIPNSVISIGAFAFEGCNGLTSITIPNSVTSIGAGAFRECNSLASITISNSVTSIGIAAFQACNGLTNITIPNSVVDIGDLAFAYCENLTSITIPNSVTSIGKKIFVCSEKLNSIKVEAGNTKYDSRENCNAIIETDSNTLISGCKATIIPNSVTGIGDYAFDGCNGLRNITIPNSMVSIGGGAFYGCNGLTSITIPNSVTSIGKKALGYSWAKKEEYKTPNFVIYGEKGSVGETYANKNGFLFEEIVEADFNKISISQATIILSQNQYIYDGKAKVPTVSVKLNGKTLKADKDYMVIYSNNIDIGTAKVIIIGKGNYTGNKSVNFKIVKASEKTDSSIICKKKVYKVAYGEKPFKINATSKSTLSFTSSNSKIATVNKNTGRVTIKGTGVATITAKAGKDSVKITVKVSPRKQSLKSVKSVIGRKLTVKWAKDKMAAGYQVQVSLNKNFSKIAQQKNVPKNSYTFTNMKIGKKYYVRVRSYKKSGKEKLYGAWSKAKQSKKVKK